MSAALPLGGDWRYGGPNRDGVITIRFIWIAFLLSLLVHIAALWTSPPLVRSLSFDPDEAKRPSGTIIAQLAPATRAEEQRPPPAPSPPARAVPPSRPTPPQRPAPRPSPAPTPPAPPAPPIARTETMTTPGPAPPPRPTPQPTPPADAKAPPVADLSAYIAAMKSARGEPPSPPPVPGDPTAKPAETETERRNRIVAANLAPVNKPPTFGTDPKGGGGVFTIKYTGYDDAEFLFTGWDKDINRVARQLIEVRKGSNPDIRLAVVRKIIEIIRAQEPGDFVWVSHRMNRMIPMSARPADNAALEDFLMREFYGGEPR